MTAADHASGTDRIAEVAQSMDYDIIVNVQGDEPLIQPEMIDDVISLLADPRASMGTLAVRIKDRREIFDLNTVKVVFSRDGYAFYFSRAPIPFHRDLFSSEERQYGRAEERKSGSLDAQGSDGFHPPELPNFQASELLMFKHIGIYSYRRDVLSQLSALPPSRLELVEKLEQLRALEAGLTIKVKETIYETFGVDTPEDLERIEKCLNSSL
jgi:3-deoxy-manno-octulosonate cytidylyltransferase (CMP-KDO synthetase)